MNVGFVKEITSGSDTMYVRDLFQGSKDIKDIEITSKIVVVCNDLPKAENADAAFWNRALVIPFESKFVDNPPETVEEQEARKIFPKDKDFGLKIPELLKPLAWYLLERRKSPMRFYEPEKVHLATKRYKNKNDTYGSFLNEYIKEDKKGKISFKNLLTEFIDWYKESKPGSHVPDSEDFREYCIKLYGHLDEGYWYGLSIVRPE